MKKKSITGSNESRRRTLAQRVRREDETEAEAAERRQADAERVKLRRNTETQDQANARRREMAERERNRREMETSEESEMRRGRMTEEQRNRREEETGEETAMRRENMRERARARRHEERVQEIEMREDRLRQYANQRRQSAMHNVGRCESASHVEEHNCGSMNYTCQLCKGFYFIGERNARGIYKNCCHGGKIIESEISYPVELRNLMDGTDDFSKHFKRNIRSYNSSLSFCSMGAKIEPPAGSGPYCFRIHGAIYHRTGHLHPHETGREQFGQIYVLDSDEALRQRMIRPENISCNAELMMRLDTVIRTVNPYAHAYKMLHEMEQEVIQEEGLQAATNIRMYIMHDRLNTNEHKGRYNAPKQNEIAMVFRSSDGMPPTNRDICIYPRGERLLNISPLNPNCEPMTYVVFFPCGEQGFKTGLVFTELQFYSHRLSVRKDIFNPILYGGKLMQQYVVDAFVKVEGNRLSFLRSHQRTLRVETYLGLADHIYTLTADSGVKPGIPVILPSTFIGSPRAMQQNYQDAMAIVRDYGKPDLFLTFTCNPKWQEITQNLFPGQQPNDRPDLVARVFDIKKKSLLEDLKKNAVLGRTVAHIHVIEFQKRGLPHMHLLLILAEEDKIRDSETIDSIVCAELPDQSTDIRLYDTITTSMIHGPCGIMNPNSPCMIDGVCSKGYPKQFREYTTDNVDGYPMYRRRDNGNFIRIRDCVLDNRWVVPYNAYLSKKYNAHINVEICSSVKSIKYIFKYVYKGHDCAKVVLKENSERMVTWDEIKSFLNARYVSAPEAMWRLLEKNMHQKSHSIIRLPVHLENMQAVYFTESEEREAFERAEQRNTMLTGWFQLNMRDPEANQYLYIDTPKHYTWKNNVWHRRVRLGDCIVSRMYSVSPRDIERFHLRMLLCHVKGAKSFSDLLTFENIQYRTFKEACRARNFLQDDDEWRNCLREACVFQMPANLRQLFSFICVFCNPTEPVSLWNEFQNELSEDFSHHHSLEESLDLALQRISQHLRVHNMTLRNLGLPESSPLALSTIQHIYDLQAERQEGQRLVEMLNQEQRVIFDCVIQAAEDGNLNTTKAFSVNAFAGAGKSFLFKAILHTVRGMGHVAVPVAWTGIAAILLHGGRTVHSTFKLPVPILENSSCNIRQNTEEASLLKSAKLIIWDECTMTPHYALDSVDRFLRDLMGQDIPFGGKLFILGGDWRQILPVAPHANRTSIIESCLKNSSMWSHFRQFNLVRNMRTDPQEHYFSEWLLSLGDGSLKNDCGLEGDLIEIPPQCIVTGSLVDDMYGSGGIKSDNFSEKSILCPKNEDSLKLNEDILRKFPGEMKTYFSADSIACDNEEEQDIFQMDFVQSVTPSGIPPHRLNLKVGVVIMLLRNLNPSSGLCNGTRLIVKRMMPNVIDAEVLTGHTAGSRVFIPRIQLSPSDTNLPFKLQRRQFPVRLSFAMTINKAQGQTLKQVGIYLPQPVFSHGMLYVAFSRTNSLKSIRVFVENTSKQGQMIKNTYKVFTPNVVFREIL